MDEQETGEKTIYACPRCEAAHVEKEGEICGACQDEIAHA